MLQYASMKFRNIFTTKTFVARVKQKAKQEGWHPVRAARELAKDAALGYAIYYGVMLLFSIGLLAVLSFTDLIGGPFVVAQVLFFLLVGTLLVAGLSGWWIWRKIKKRVRNFSDQLNPRHRADVHEGSVIEGQITKNDDNEA